MARHRPGGMRAEQPHQIPRVGRTARFAGIAGQHPVAGVRAPGENAPETGSDQGRSGATQQPDQERGHEQAADDA